MGKISEKLAKMGIKLMKIGIKVTEIGVHFTSYNCQLTIENHCFINCTAHNIAIKTVFIENSF